MGDPRLANYTTSLKARGVSKSDALKYLERYGYTPSEVKSAVRQTYGNSNNTLFIVLILLALIGTGVWFWSTNSTTEPTTITPPTITLNIEAPKEVNTGNNQGII